MTADESQIGLRERKKRAMRASLSNIALRLAMERGVAQVRAEDIAAEAGVSTRTFNNYFPNKEAAIVGIGVVRADLFCMALRARPASEALQDAICAAVLALFVDEPDREWIVRARLIRSEPSVFAEERKSDIEIEQMIAAEIGRRTGADPSVDLSPRLSAAMVLTAMRTAIQFWLDTPVGGTLRETLIATMGKLCLKRVLQRAPDGKKTRGLTDQSAIRRRA
ncbi:acyl-CoA-like ligand-binding transcription factor [Acidisoma silvae]|uniref:TetR family transcriptional regulator n=1 Tax=Acidisoma silvae TaxID=2802396 RepID=A0A963YV41_9PROT|nr:TetR family transcriptional regulator [Acidisoma silvae]MCB8877406.1 TetR family transcriptional regulator [Acidisoma silvae]